MLNQQWLTTFITLVELGHFTQTAETLFMTQPGVSQHIKKLEHQVGCALINRIGKRFELTEAGIAIYEYACDLQRQQLELLSSLHVDETFAGECKIGCSGSMAALLYPYLINDQQAYPELIMLLEAGPNKRTLDGILSNQLDLGIVTQQVVQPELTSIDIGKQSLCLVIPKCVSGKPIDAKVNYELLSQLGMIDHPDANFYWQQICSAFFNSESAKNIRKSGYVNQLNQILLPVAKGLGFTVLPEFAVRCFAQYDDIQIAYIANDKPVMLFEPLYLVHKQHRKLAKRYQRIIQLIKSLVNND
ncbi:LysR family transcriptional regulator [Shewanella subflava]|uniref:LysR family transcriptional regulator n=1 Tax=Shewanella subflava TaxID=2986476 RepID=A0ABT3I6W3_9GAMM|nr:LysR family transcriptional regulator [Shewanella subflava]MCW3171695.1 LysR family transcriptional regulator [Shewanella subflava]